MDDGKRLAEFLTGLGYGDLPARVVEAAKDAVLDQLGVPSS